MLSAIAGRSIRAGLAGRCSGGAVSGRRLAGRNVARVPVRSRLILARLGRTPCCSDIRMRADVHRRS